MEPEEIEQAEKEPEKLLNEAKNNGMLTRLMDMFHNYQPKDFKGIKEEMVYQDEAMKITILWKIVGIEHKYKEARENEI